MGGIQTALVGSFKSRTNFTVGGNYIGEASDGDVVISSNTSLVVPNKVGSYDGDMVVKQYKSLTINSGITLTTDQPCRGLFIYVQGNCTINGTLSMTGRGAAANPTASGASDASAVNATGLRYGFKYTGGTDTLTMSSAEFSGCGTTIKSIVGNQPSGAGTNYKVITVQRTGTAGATRGTAMPSAPPNVPANALAGYSGGGTSGGGYNAGYNGYIPGSGASGTCFSGGSGGGGYNSNGGAGNGGDGVANGGAGGNGFSGSELGGTFYNRIGSGGAGNPKGSTQNSGSSWEQAGAENGTGGLIFLIVGGTLTIGSGASIQANGMKGGPGGAGDGRGGGSGGGVVNVLYSSIANSGTITADGVASAATGNQGGKGSTQVFQML